MTKIYDWKEVIKEDELNNVIDTLKNNGLVILPTETVYGIASSAFSDEACKKIFTAKGRAQDNPLIVHVSNKEMIYDIVEKPSEIEEKLIRVASILAAYHSNFSESSSIPVDYTKTKMPDYNLLQWNPPRGL